MKVLFHIKWSHPTSHYFLNAGAYDHEQEILLADGASLNVFSMEDIYSEGFGILGGFVGAKAANNGLQVKLLKAQKDGKQQVEMIDPSSDKKGMKFNVNLNNILVE